MNLSFNIFAPDYKDPCLLADRFSWPVTQGMTVMTEKVTMMVMVNLLRPQTYADKIHRADLRIRLYFIS